MWVRMFFKSIGSFILDCSYSHSDTVCRKSVKQGNLESQHNFASIQNKTKQNNTIEYNKIQYNTINVSVSVQVKGFEHPCTRRQEERGRLCFCWQRSRELLYLLTLSSMHGTELQYNRFKCMSHLLPDAPNQLPVVEVAKTAWKVSKCSHKDVTVF